MTTRDPAGEEARSRYSAAVAPCPADSRVATLLIRLVSLTVLSAILVDKPIALAVAHLPQWFRISALWLSEASAPHFVMPILLITGVFGLLSAGARPTQGPAFGVFGLCCGLAALTSSLLVKTIIGRARPDGSHDWDRLLFRPFAFEDAFASMPSTQAALAAAVTCAAAIRFPQYRICLLVAGVLICASRVIVGEHWTSDVIAGWTLGWLTTRVMLRLFANPPDHVGGSR